MRVRLFVYRFCVSSYHQDNMPLFPHFSDSPLLLVYQCIINAKRIQALISPRSERAHISMSPLMAYCLRLLTTVSFFYIFLFLFLILLIYSLGQSKSVAPGPGCSELTQEKVEF